MDTEETKLVAISNGGDYRSSFRHSDCCVLLANVRRFEAASGCRALLADCACCAKLHTCTLAFVM